MTRTELCERYYRDMVSYLTTLTRDSETAQDLTQVTFLKACAAWTTSQAQRSDAQSVAWLKQIARRTCYDARAHAAVQGRHVLDTPLEEWTAHTDDLVERVGERVKIASAIAALKAPERALITDLAAGWHYRDLSERSGISMHAAACRVMRARRAFRRAYQLA